MTSHRRWIHAGILLLFILVGLAVYGNSLKNGFHYDDIHHIVQNPFIHTPANIPLFFTDPSTFSLRSTVHTHYRPLILASYSLNYYFGRLNPVGYHLVNLAFHIGSAFLIYLILVTMLTRAAASTPLALSALAGGLFFLVHPFNTEVVNYITARSSVMCTFFYLLAFWFWVKYRTSETEGIVRYPALFYAASLLTFLLAMLTKEIAITLPVLLWLYDILYGRHAPSPDAARRRGLAGSSFSDWRTYLPYLPFALVGIFLGFLFRKIFFGKVMSAAAVPGLNQGLTDVVVWAKYILTLMIPMGLSASHDIPKIDSPLNGRFLLSFLLLSALVIAVYRMLRSRDPLWMTGFFFASWFFVSLLPTSLVTLNAVYQENRGYIAAAGFAGIVVILLLKGSTWQRRPPFFTKALSGLAVLVLVLYAVIVVERNPDWKNNESLWRSVLRVYPQSEGARNEIALIHWEAGDIAKAKELLQETLEINPRNVGALINLGVITLMQNDVQKAEEYLKRAILANPYRPETYNPLGQIYEAQGRFQEAAQLYLMGYQYIPQSPLLARRLFDVYDRMGKLDEARIWFERGVAEDPTNVTLHRTLGWIYKKQGNRKKEIEALERILLTKPDDLEALFELREAYQKEGRWDQVETIDRKAMAFLPVKSVRVAENSFIENRKLALFYRQWGRYPEALEAFQAALKQGSGVPELPDVYNEISTVYFAMGSKIEALESLEKALAMEPTHWQSRANLGLTYESMGKDKLAGIEYQKILQGTSPFGEDETAYKVAKSRLERMNSVKKQP